MSQKKQEYFWGDLCDTETPVCLSLCVKCGNSHRNNVTFVIKSFSYCVLKFPKMCSLKINSYSVDPDYTFPSSYFSRFFFQLTSLWIHSLSLTRKEQASMRQQPNKTNKCNLTKLKLLCHVRTRPLPTEKGHQVQAQEDICDRLSWATNPLKFET